MEMEEMHKYRVGSDKKIAEVGRGLSDTWVVVVTITLV